MIEIQIEIRGFPSNPEDPRSCMCCGRIIARRERLRCRSVEEARARIEALEALGYTKEDMLGLFREHIEWQAPGLIPFVRASLI